MKVEEKRIAISEIVKNYVNKNENGVTGWDNRLDIRPAYQREFIYNDKERNDVIETVRQNLPLNTMWWAKTTNGNYEVMDGQQRTMSICEYVASRFSINYQYFHNLEEEEKNQILNYKLLIYFCEGKKKETLNWYRKINMQGKKQTNQELRNINYTGAWLHDAKKHFSKTNCPAKVIASKYMKGSPIRQDYLETAISWASKNNIEEFMAVHQHKQNANKLWLYFRHVIDWVDITFPIYRKQMKGLPFGPLYDEFWNKDLNPDKLEEEITSLLLDEDVTKKAGIWQYVLTRDEKYLNIRSFSNNQKIETYERQGGVCAKCGKHFKLHEMEADHIKPWSEGGKTISDNCQMLCKHDNRIKSNK